MRSRLQTLLIIPLAVLAISLASPVFAVSPPNQTDAPAAPANTHSDCPNDDPNCYVLLTPLPLSNPSNAGSPDKTANTSTYISGVIDLTIALVGGITVIMLIIAGFQYIITDNFSKKSNARETMKNALVGLILVIGAVTVLSQISQQFTVLGLNILPINNPGVINDQGTCAGVIDKDGNCSTAVGGSSADANAVGCVNNCTAANTFSFPQKAPPIGCDGDTCFISRSLGSQLDDLNKYLQADGVHWQVSEMFPPTVPHKDDCHKPNNNQSGTCVDAVFLNASDPATMKKIMADTSKVFSSFVYEACPQSRTDALKKQFPDYASHFNCYSTTDGDNMHINMSGSSASF